MPDFSSRSQDIEIMDNLACEGEVVNQTLRELETINSLLGGNHVTLDALNRVTRKIPKSVELTIYDLGCGSGDMLRLIHHWAERHGRRVHLTGIDANPFIIKFARDHTRHLPIAFEAMDIFSNDFQSRRFDIVIGTLFYHHFADESLSAFFGRLKDQTRYAIIINDIHRHWFAYYSIKWLTQLFSRSGMVKFDAPLSVLRAFSRDDLKNIFKNAGVSRYEIRWKWAFRWQVIIYTAA